MYVCGEWGSWWLSPSKVYTKPTPLHQSLHSNYNKRRKISGERVGTSEGFYVSRLGVFLSTEPGSKQLLAQQHVREVSMFFL